MLLTFKVGIIRAEGLVASRAAAADAAQRNKQNRRIRATTELGSVWTQICVALNGRKRGRKTPETDLRAPKRRKKNGNAVDPEAVSDSLN